MKVGENDVLICGRYQEIYESDWYGSYTTYVYTEDAFDAGVVVDTEEYEKTSILRNGETTVIFDEDLGYCNVTNVAGRAIFLHDNGRRMFDDEGKALDENGCRVYDDEDTYGGYGTYGTTDV